MDTREFGTQVKVLRASYPANNILSDKDEWNIWFMKLQTISYKVAAKVIDEMISGLSAFPPTLPQILAKCNAKMYPGIPSPNEAWRLIENAASKYGIYHWEQALENVPEVIMNTARGQLYRDICLSEDREAVRRHFMSVYKENVSQIQESQLPQYMRQKLREYDVFMKDSYNCELPENEICQKLSMTKRELRRMEEIHNRLQYYSADAPVKEDDEQSVLIDGIPSDIDIEGKVLAAEWEKDLHNTLQEAFGVLDKKTLQMIKCFYYLGYGKTKIARMTNCSGSYVGSRIERGLKKMRNAYGHELAEFMDDGFCYDEDQISENEYIEEDDEQCNLFLI